MQVLVHMFSCIETRVFLPLGLSTEARMAVSAWGWEWKAIRQGVAMGMPKSKFNRNQPWR